ncbi:MAG TPA: hypothetical protein PLF92_09485 [Arenimonas sp.]|jgi:hypothetical protein|nr:hypothetical protein [Arenimonas sp.]HPO23646.1 hypothetical protein [Arenimonas sp.]HPW33126.1 hypothetical protein [Arenimonas sp.]
MTSKTFTAKAENVRIIPVVGLPVVAGLNVVTLVLVLVLIIIGGAG